MSGLIVVYEIVTRRNNEALSWDVELDLNIGTDLREMLNNYLVDENWQLMNIISIKIEKKCYGCRNDRPGQRDHMEEGGCLYQQVSDIDGSAEL